MPSRGGEGDAQYHPINYLVARDPGFTLLAEARGINLCWGVHQPGGTRVGLQGQKLNKFEKNNLEQDRSQGRSKKTNK